ncbi:flagellar hook-length control protein FliK [Burkholderia oklahomensis]|uniref:flagellar hook-length control protein FliK n=4 Tax=Burkholderia oklahomensis TaxID=342113 RepID=UPI0005D9C1F6|nr:flagellar hook-length control protein FliK [Burkholderia oklahomensis]AJX34978.1 flagellar hook-length control FliK family protein [Burkholderia oklahomensis C6786]AOI47964.1 hypothetical protein WI23_18795 [Burkholderia oklahomensis C6786]KUY50164.1 hypothetical protein WI23_03175 [Burkholderia oklahomensis C6786]MBI0363932.1 flagellar hook-length control protein FliK [Burkholderia oklahomensis]SUY28093.1 Flagellar hook-length control protein FliK [Burkholderia oklahomensis]
MNATSIPFAGRADAGSGERAGVRLSWTEGPTPTPAADGASAGQNDTKPARDESKEPARPDAFEQLMQALHVSAEVPASVALPAAAAAPAGEASGLSVAQPAEARAVPAEPGVAPAGLALSARIDGPSFGVHPMVDRTAVSLAERRPAQAASGGATAVPRATDGGDRAADSRAPAMPVSPVARGSADEPQRVRGEPPSAPRADARAGQDKSSALGQEKPAAGLAQPSGFPATSDLSGASGAVRQAATQSAAAQWGTQLLNSLGERVSVQVRDGIGQAVIHLEPQSFGTLRIAIRHEAGAVRIQLVASNEEIARQLQTVSEALRQDLAGRHNGDVSVVVRHGQGFGHGEREPQRETADDRDARPGMALAEADTADDDARFRLDGPGVG